MGPADLTRPAGSTTRPATLSLPVRYRTTTLILASGTVRALMPTRAPTAGCFLVTDAAHGSDFLACVTSAAARGGAV
jgi:hypothetical protein